MPSYLEIAQSQKSTISVIPKNLSKHPKNDFRRTGQAWTAQDKQTTRQDWTRQAKRGDRANLAHAVWRGRGLSNPKGGDLPGGSGRGLVGGLLARRSHSERRRQPPDASRRLQDDSKTAPGRSKTAPRRSKTPQDAPKTLQDAPRRSKTPSRHPQDASKTRCWWIWEPKTKLNW